MGIDHEKPLSGTTPPYRQHVVICTGRDDWASRIEKEEGPNLAKGLKELVGPKGEFHDVCVHILARLAGPQTFTKKFVAL